MSNFVPYLTKRDYLPVIQEEQLSYQILDEIEAGTRELEFAESWALGKIRAKIDDQYDLDFEFTDTLPYDPLKKYFGNERCVLDFPDWVSDTAYFENNCVVNNGIAYRCINVNNDIVFDPFNWLILGKRYDIYYIPLVNPIFSLDVQQRKGNYTAGYYRVDDIVWWNNRHFRCLIPTRFPDQEGIINYQTYRAWGHNNVFPHYPDENSYWKDEGAFEFTGENPTSLSEVWRLGDNRNPLFIQAVVDLSLYLLHSRIAPMNIPALRVDRMKLTNEWLSNLSKGTETTPIQMLQPDQGENISWGSKPRVINGY